MHQSWPCQHPAIARFVPRCSDSTKRGLQSVQQQGRHTQSCQPVRWRAQQPGRRERVRERCSKPSKNISATPIAIAARWHFGCFGARPKTLHFTGPSLGAPAELCSISLVRDRAARFTRCTGRLPGDPPLHLHNWGFTQGAPKSHAYLLW